MKTKRRLLVRSLLAAPFVMTIGATAPACSSAKTSGADVTTKPQRDFDLHRRADGSCWRSHNITCPPDATCNPPPPEPVDCPADPKELDWDHWKPPAEK